MRCGRSSRRWPTENPPRNRRGSRGAVFVGTIGFAFLAFSDEAMGIIRDIPPAARTLRERLEAQRTKASETALEQVQEAATEIDKAAAKASEPAVKLGACRKSRSCSLVPDFGLSRDGRRHPAAWRAVRGDPLSRLLHARHRGPLQAEAVKIAGPTLTKKKITVQILDEINRQIESFIKVQVFTSALVGVGDGVGALVVRRQSFRHLGDPRRHPQLDPLHGTDRRERRSCGRGVPAVQRRVKMMYVAGTAMVITSLEGFLLDAGAHEPRGQMNPAAIFIGLLFWSWVWGIWGTILAGADDDDDQGGCDHVEDLQPIGELLGE